jgi:hypothetical protein
LPPQFLDGATAPRRFFLYVALGMGFIDRAFRHGLSIFAMPVYQHLGGTVGIYLGERHGRAEPLGMMRQNLDKSVPKLIQDESRHTSKDDQHYASGEKNVAHPVQLAAMFLAISSQMLNGSCKRP